MKIFIPMAGKGTRLRPFTLTCPKPLINILDKPIVEHLIDQITSKVKSNIDEIVYILGDESYFNAEVVHSLNIISEKYNAKTKIYRQLEQLGTGHAIMCAEESLSGPSIIAYADTMIHGNIEIDRQVEIVFTSSVWQFSQMQGTVRRNLGPFQSSQCQFNFLCKLRKSLSSIRPLLAAVLPYVK